jgi:predicted short-subunit dehydrogenase-like oxidoreductase (DUF2520 family)
MVRLGFIGAGTVGSALAVRLISQGYPVVAVSSRGKVSAGKLARSINSRAVDTNQAVADAAELVFITTPDSVIPTVAAEVRWHAGQSVVHCSGADSTQTLEPARKAGAGVGVIHPLQTFASAREAVENIPGSTFALEADEPLLGLLKQIATDLEGHWIVLRAEDKVVYHAAAVIACNYLVTLVKLATDLWQAFGVPAEQAVQALLPLVRGTVHNIETVGIPRCLTGPIARGDGGTVRKHIDALERVAPAILPAYRELGLQTIPIALAKGRIDRKQAGELEELISQN